MKKMLKKVKRDDVLATFYLTIGTDPNQTYQKYLKLIGVKSRYKIEGAMGICISRPDLPESFIWLEQWDLNTAAHEAYHAAHHIMVRYHEYYDEEALAELTGWITEQLWLAASQLKLTLKPSRSRSPIQRSIQKKAFKRE